MDFYQWKYDVPGNIQGVVIGSDPVEALERVRQYLVDTYGHCTEQLIFIEWVGNAADKICELKE